MRATHCCQMMAQIIHSSLDYFVGPEQALQKQFGDSKRRSCSLRECSVLLGLVPPASNDVLYLTCLCAETKCHSRDPKPTVFDPSDPKAKQT